MISNDKSYLYFKKIIQKMYKDLIIDCSENFIELNNDKYLNLYSIYLDELEQSKLKVRFLSKFHSKHNQLIRVTKKNLLKKYQIKNINESWIKSGFLIQFEKFNELKEFIKLNNIYKDLVTLVLEKKKTIEAELLLAIKYNNINIEEVEIIEDVEIIEELDINRKQNVCKQTESNIYSVQAFTNNIPTTTTQKKSKFKVTDENDTEYISEVSKTTKIKVSKENELIDKDEKLLTINTFYLLDEYNSSIENDEIELSYSSERENRDSEILKESLSLMTIEDKNILDILLNHIQLTEQFVYNGEISLSFRNICNILSEMKIIDKYNYSKLKGTLMRLNMFSCDRPDVKFQIIDYYSQSLENDDITIRFGSVVRNEIMKNITIKIYIETFEKLNINSPTPRILFILQELRIRLEVEIRKVYKRLKDIKENNEFKSFDYRMSILKEKVFEIYDKYNYLEIELPFRYFEKSFIYNSRKSNYITMINNALIEIKNNDILIQEFEYVVQKEVFRIKFKNLSKENINIIEKEENPFAHIVLENTNY